MAGGPGICTQTVCAEMVLLQTRAAGPELAMNCEHRLSMRFGGECS